MNILKALCSKTCNSEADDKAQKANPFDLEKGEKRLNVIIRHKTPFVLSADTERISLLVHNNDLVHKWNFNAMIKKVGKAKSPIRKALITTKEGVALGEDHVHTIGKQLDHTCYN